MRRPEGPGTSHPCPPLRSLTPSDPSAKLHSLKPEHDNSHIVGAAGLLRGARQLLRGILGVGQARCHLHGLLVGQAAPAAALLISKQAVRWRSAPACPPLRGKSSVSVRVKTALTGMALLRHVL